MSERGPGSVVKGLGFTFLLHFLQALVGPAVFLVTNLLVPAKSNQYGASGLIVALGGLGITQLVYMIPVTLRFKKLGEFKTVQGLLIGAGVTFLLCATCDGLLHMPKR